MEPLRWSSIVSLFDEAATLPRPDREKFLARIANIALRGEVASLLDASDAAGKFLDAPPPIPPIDGDVSHTLQPDSRIGAWRIVRLIGHGGMGEVYEVGRADGPFEQRAALKLTRTASSTQLSRFNAERQILARLDHPGIARLLDGGIAPDGRPFAVMEYVEGETLLQYCESRALELDRRLSLFLQVCDAVACAHRSLIVHRDIKPGNVLVDATGRARLLDFGIAKPLDAPASPEGSGSQTLMLLTPDYASPEQLRGEPVTTATDIHALGLLLFELLVGHRPWHHTSDMPLARLIALTLEKPAPRASETARSVAQPAVPPKLLEGDLDSIISKCLRREPRHRYATVNELNADVERSRQGHPVLAREGARLYVLGRFVHRHRLITGSVASVIAVLVLSVVITTWQANRANREAARAAATRDFLIGVFRESDPSIARDGAAAGSATAKELLDRSVGRIETDFAQDPHTQLELLGVVSLIYGYWLDEERFENLLQKRMHLARTHFGETHPVVIDSIVLRSWDSIYTQDYATANKLLQDADRLIRKGGHEDSIVRANWWQARAEALRNADPALRMGALDKAVSLYAKVAPDRSAYAISLANSAIAHQVREDFEGALARNQKAVEVFLRAKDRSDIDLAATYANLARSLQAVGEFARAEEIYETNARLVRQTLGERHAAFWHGRADHARLIHLRGDRERAWRKFDELFAVIPDDWSITTDPANARELYAERLSAEGRAAEAVPWLERVEAIYQERPAREFDLRRLRQTLGDAYDRAGRTADARRALLAARDERMQKDAPGSIAVLGVRERWARFLLDRGDIQGALAELREVVRLGGGKALAPLALAHSDLARLAIARNDGAAALAESKAALAALEGDKGLYDVRIGPVIWRVHAQALRLTGDVRGANDWTARADSASARYDGTPSVRAVSSR
jgi:eukaryotic-like serine/threonine-protein kinase